MKKLFYCVFVIFCGVGLIFSSCEKKESDLAAKKDDSESSEVWVTEQGVLAFKTQEVFDKELSKVDQMEFDEALAYFKQYDFNSLASDTLGSNNVFYTPDISLRFFLNKDAAIQIADSIHILRDTREIIVSNKDISSFKKVISGEIIENINIKIVPIKSTSFSQEMVIGEDGIAKLDNSSQSDVVFKSSTYPPAGNPYGPQTPLRWTDKFFSPESTWDGHQERVRVETFSTVTAFSYRMGVSIEGQNYLSGGIFGSWSWRGNYQIMEYRIFGSVNTSSDSPGVFRDFDTGYRSFQKAMAINFAKTTSTTETLQRLELTVQFHRSTTAFPCTIRVSFNYPYVGSRTVSW